MATTKPNILFIMTDEERYPPPYESEADGRRSGAPSSRPGSGCGPAAWSSTATTPRSTACIPSRASLFTGQYPSLHGVTDTDGLAKAADDPADDLARPRHRAHHG